jgi:signal transduction histidine kinase
VAAVNLGGRPFRIIAGSISAQNLAQRVAVPRTGDELQRISETWNEVLERVEIPVKRIRQFTVDASHKLRTPRRSQGGDRKEGRRRKDRRSAGEAGGHGGEGLMKSAPLTIAHLLLGAAAWGARRHQFVTGGPALQCSERDQIHSLSFRGGRVLRHPRR